MSLLLDALRARKAKEEGQSVEPVEFSGPVINADEVLGRSDALPALEPAQEPALEPALRNAREYESAVSQLENSTPGATELPDSVALSQSVSDQFATEFTTVSQTAKHLSLIHI